MDGCRADRAHGVQGSGELTLECTLVVDLLAEVRDRQSLVVEQFVALGDDRALDAVGCQVGPEPVHVRLWNQDPGSAAFEAVVDVLCLEAVDDLRELRGVYV